MGHENFSPIFTLIPNTPLVFIFFYLQFHGVTIFHSLMVPQFHSVILYLSDILIYLDPSDEHDQMTVRRLMTRLAYNKHLSSDKAMIDHCTIDPDEAMLIVFLLLCLLFQNFCWILCLIWFFVFLVCAMLPLRTMVVYFFLCCIFLVSHCFYFGVFKFCFFKEEIFFG